MGKSLAAQLKEMQEQFEALKAENEQLRQSRVTVQVTERKRKLTEDQVRDMRRLYKDGTSISKLSRDYGVSTTFVRHIVVARDVYRNVT